MSLDHPTLKEALEHARRWTVGARYGGVSVELPGDADVAAMAEAERANTAIQSRWINYAQLLMALDARERMDEELQSRAAALATFTAFTLSDAEVDALVDQADTVTENGVRIVNPVLADLVTRLHEWKERS